jgi:hypothetical protein
LQSNRARVAIALGAVVVGVVLFAVLNNGGDQDGGSKQATPTGTTERATGATGATGSTGSAGSAGKQEYEIVVKNGKPVGGIEEMEYKKGEQVRFVVRSDVADEIHVHGYDLMRDVEAGGSVRFDFPASIEGVFEIELEGRKEQIAELRVNPS